MNTKNVITRIVLIIVCVSEAAFCLEAPYLISATAQSDSTIKIMWRNNDIATQGFIIKRADSTETSFKPIDTINSSTQTSFIDSFNIKPLKSYSYQILAFQEGMVSDTSNRLQVTSLSSSLREAFVNASWNCDYPKAVKLNIVDNSKNETGYRIYRSEGNSSIFSLKASIVSTNPIATDTIVWIDSTISPNTWYGYQAVAYTQSDTMLSKPCTTFTFNKPIVQEVAKFTKISEFPITLGGWSAKAGDSIILKESNSPDGKYSVVNVKDPSNPKFVGYIDSTALISYPLNTLIPAFLKFGIKNSGLSQNVIYNKDRIIVSRFNSLALYNSSDLSLIDSLTIDQSKTFVVNDSILYIYQPSTYSFPYTYQSNSLVKFTKSGFSLLPEKFSEDSRSGMNAQIRTYSNIAGFIQDNAVISIDYSYHSFSDIIKNSIEIYNIISNKKAFLSNDPVLSQTYSTGYHISSTENISYNRDSLNELFISNSMDFRGYQTALRNNAIYRDSSLKNLQNIIVDTTNKMVFLITDNKLSILSYDYSPAVAAKRVVKRVDQKETMSLTNLQGSGVNITFSDARSKPIDLRIFDISGRMVDRIVTSNVNSIHWQPKSKTANFYVAVANVGNDRFIEKIMVK